MRGSRFLISVLALTTILALRFPFIGYSQPHAQRLRAHGQISFHVSPSGSDSNNDCLTQETPCQTIQYAVARLMSDWDFAWQGDPLIRLGPGTYSEGVVLTGQPVGAHSINIVGQQDVNSNQSCSLAQAEQVIIRGAPGRPVFLIQDLAIGVVRCLTIEGADAVAFFCRQTPASDIAFVKLGNSQSLAAGIQANENCGVNLAGAIWLGANIDNFLSADLISRVTVGGGTSITALGNIQMTHFALSYQQSLLEFRSGVSVVGPISTKYGSLVWRGGAIITNGLKLPGGIAQAKPNAPGFID